MSGQRRSRASKFSQNEISDLVSRLQGLLPQLNQRPNSRQSASKILQETCCHIRRLQEEVEQLSERLSELMDSLDINEIDRQILQNLFSLNTPKQTPEVAQGNILMVGKKMSSASKFTIRMRSTIFLPNYKFCFHH
ncbi:unnamed protein product [Sphenostylis stenocarpa]|uniref:BHLH domain-containing protein n=1 Tax=Sphenostylis stenocarpa TaxID=92480 RepID=A0AA86V8F7_9FABA|nr:unnamed protein product [Sphenostylis stenocarpa]